MTLEPDNLHIWINAQIPQHLLLPDLLIMPIRLHLKPLLNPLLSRSSKVVAHKNNAVDHLSIKGVVKGDRPLHPEPINQVSE